MRVHEHRVRADGNTQVRIGWAASRERVMRLHLCMPRQRTCAQPECGAGLVVGGREGDESESDPEASSAAVQPAIAAGLAFRLGSRPRNGHRYDTHIHTRMALVHSCGESGAQGCLHISHDSTADLARVLRRSLDTGEVRLGWGARSRCRRGSRRGERGVCVACFEYPRMSTPCALTR